MVADERPSKRGRTTGELARGSSCYWGGRGGWEVDQGGGGGEALEGVKKGVLELYFGIMVFLLGRQEGEKGRERRADVSR